MRRLGSFALAALLAACGSPPPKPVAVAPVDSRPALVRLGDSTSVLIASAIRISDSANVQARVALSESSPTLVRYRVEAARDAARSAGAMVEAAMAQGDYISE